MDRKWLLAQLTFCLAAASFTACGGSDATAPGGASDSPRGSRPQLYFVHDSAASAGAMVGELIITVPDTGATRGEAVLYAPGTVQGDALLEVAGDLNLDNGHVPTSEIFATSGFILYYRPDGELRVRQIGVFFYVLPATCFRPGAVRATNRFIRAPLLTRYGCGRPGPRELGSRSSGTSRPIPRWV